MVICLAGALGLGATAVGLVKDWRALAEGVISVGTHAVSSGAKEKITSGKRGVVEADASSTSREYVATAVKAVQQPVTLRLTGSLEADEKSEVSANTTGIVAEVRVDRGSMVKKGDVLVQLDPVDAENALAEGVAAIRELMARLGIDNPKTPYDPNEQPDVKAAKLALELASANYERAKNLHSKEVLTREVFDQTQTEYLSAVQRHQSVLRGARQLYQTFEMALARAAILRKAVTDTTIIAPFDGWVAERCVSVGERVVVLMPGGAKIVTLVRIDPLRLRLTVPQQHIGSVRSGASVRFQVDAFPGKAFEGKVRYISPAVTAESRSLLIEAVVPNVQVVLHPGLFVTAELQLEQLQTNLFVPRSAVGQRDDVARVFVLRGKLAREQIVSLGEAEGTMVRVILGVTDKDQVIVNPENLHDGDQVQP